MSLLMMFAKGRPDRSLSFTLNTTPIKFSFDAIFNESHESKLTITEHSIEDGSKITDHAYMNPKMLTVEAGVSDSARILDMFSGGYNFKTINNMLTNDDVPSNGGSRSQTAFKILHNLQESRILVDISTGLKLYKNCLIESISTKQDKNNPKVWKFTATFKEIRIIKNSIVDIPPERRLPGKTTRKTQPLNIKGKVQGTQPPAAKNVSWLGRLIGR